MDKSLLDTDILSEIGKGIDANVAINANNYINLYGNFTTSAISVMEVVSGYQRKKIVKRLQDFLLTASSFDVLPFDQTTGELAGRISGDLEYSGHPIGTADPMIAAIAILHGLTLVTGNTAHFQQVQQLGYPLKLANWRN